MFRHFILLLSGTILAAAAVAQTPDIFGRATGLDAPSLSPSGRYLAVECAPQGMPSACIFDLSGQSESRLIPVGGDYRLQGHYWPNDDYLILEVSQFESIQTASGQKKYDFKRALSYNLASGEATLLMRDEYGLLDTQNVVSVLPEDGRNVLILATAQNTGRSSSSHGSVIPDRGGVSWTLATYRVDLKTGKSRRDNIYAPSVERVWFDAKGDMVAELVRLGERSDTVELRSGGKTLVSYKTDQAADFYVLCYDAESRQLIVFNDVGERDGLYYLSIETGEIEPITLSGEPVGRASSIRDTYTRAVVGFEYYDGLPDQYFVDKELKSVHETLKAALPEKRVSLNSWNRDKTKIVVKAQSLRHPADYYVFDRGLGQLGPVGSSASHMVSRETGAVTAETVEMRDGLQIEIMTTLPPGRTVSDGPFPTVIMPHGGPEARDGLEYDWWAQAYAAEGYAVLQPNFRGSDGYGQELRNAGFGEFGGRMIDDIADTGAWAVETGLAEGGQYCVIGASYGGYAALMMGLKDAGRTACVVSVNGVSDPFRLIARHDVDSQTYQYWERYIGSNRYSGEADRKTVSPLQRAGDFTAPVMLLYGEEDLIVPTEQSLQLAGKLGDHPGFEAVSLGAEDHYLATSRVRNDVLRHSLAFLEKHHPAR